MSYIALTLRLGIARITETREMLKHNTGLRLAEVFAIAVTLIALIVFRTDIVSAFDSAACFVGAC